MMSNSKVEALDVSVISNEDDEEAIKSERSTKGESSTPTPGGESDGSSRKSFHELLDQAK